MSSESKPAPILIIEDNPENRELATWILEDAGYDSECADTAEKGLELLEKNEYSLVLMDISLPGMDGKEATQKIRENPRTKDIIVIALTAHAILEEREAILKCGVNDMLTKPVEEEQMIAKINELIGPGA